MPDRYKNLSEPLLDALLKSKDCVEILDKNGIVRISNRQDRFNCDDRIGEQWIQAWPETSRNDALIALDEAREGRTERFSSYRPIGKDDAWWDVTVTPMEQDNNLIAILVVSRDVTRIHQLQAEITERAIQAERTSEERDLVSREMRHRLKNQLASIEGLARMTARSHKDTAAFLQAFRQRLSSLSISQDMLSSYDNTSISLSEAITTIVQMSGIDDQITINNLPDDVILTSNSLTALSLILGELATNSLKYGALSENSGHIELDCSPTSKALRIIWREDAKSPISPGKEGSGTQLMTRMSAGSGIPFEQHWHETGVTCQFGVPMATA